MNVYVYRGFDGELLLRAEPMEPSKMRLWNFVGRYSLGEALPEDEIQDAGNEDETDASA